MNTEHRRTLLDSLVAAHAVAPKARSVDEGLFFAVITLRDSPQSAIPELVDLLKMVQSIPELGIFDGARQCGPGGASPVDFFFWCAGFFPGHSRRDRMSRSGTSSVT